MALTNAPAPEPAGDAPPARMPRFWESPRRVMLLIVGVSLLLRIALFAELSRGPCLELHRWDGGDMYLYDGWARSIAAGDLLSRDVERPVPRALVQDYLSTHPSEAAALAGTSDPEATLWKRWTGDPGFYTDPLYPYLVALTYLVTGADPRHVFAWQLALGIGINLLVFLLTRRFFGAGAGAIAGLMATLYAPLLYYEVQLLREVPIAFAALGLVCLTLKALESDRVACWGALGIASALAFLLKSTLLLEVLGLWAGALLLVRRQGHAALPSVAAAILGFALAVSPLVARNVAVGAPALAVAGNGPFTFILGNAADGADAQGLHLSAHAPRILGEGGGRLLPAALATLRTHPSVGSWLRKLWGKVSMTFNWFEIPNNASFYYFRLHSALLRWLPVTFFSVGPLGLVGLALALRRGRDRWPLYVLFAASFLPLVAFVTLSRLRLPMAIALLPFAAHAVAEIARGARARERRDAARALGAAACVLLLLPWTGRGSDTTAEQIRVLDYMVPIHVHYQPAMTRLIASEDYAAVAALLEELIRTEPAILGELGPERRASGEWERRTTVFFASARRQLAVARWKLGDAPAAELQQREVERLEAALR